jgi:competence protein ComEA
MNSGLVTGSGKAQLVAFAIAAVLLVVGGAFLLQGDGGGAKGGGPVTLDGARAGPATGDAAAGEGRRPRGLPDGGPMYVHVAGAVRRPGVYRLAPGARVAAAVRRAGGLTRRADLTAFNLAAPLRDAQQVIVPRRGQGSGTATASAGTQSGASGAAATAGAGAGPGGKGGKVSLATATPQQLEALEGIGPKLAAAIVTYRNQHHGFKSVDELREVDGIGEKRFAALRGAVRP